VDVKGGRGGGGPFKPLLNLYANSHGFSLTILRQPKRFGICNISQFYPRPGTPAARMTRIDTKIVKNRSRKISKFFNSLDPYSKMSGSTVDVWFGVDKDNTKTKSVGHTKSYVKVLVPLDDDLVGCRGTVEIGKVSRFHVEGRVVEGSVIRLVPKPAGGWGLIGGGRKREDNCDELNYRVGGTGDAGACGTGGCGGEEKKEGGECCGGESCGGGGEKKEEGGGEEQMDKDRGGKGGEEDKVGVSDKQKYVLGAGITIGLTLVSLGVYKSLKRRK
jgi:hypothetical protein